MATEFLKVINRASSTLDGNIADDALELDVGAGEGVLFPDEFPFHITIEDEILSCTNRATDTLTVVRAQQGTVAVAHTSGVDVQLRITAKSISDLNTAVNALEATGLTVAETEVFTGTSPNATWTDLDLSGTVGAQATLVILKVNPVELSAVAFRKNGDTDEFYSATGDENAAGCALANMTATKANYCVFLVATDNAGVVEWISENNKINTTVDIIAYIK